jgi:hypothetical protein
MRFARHLHQRPANSHDELSPVLLTGRNGKRVSISSLTSLPNRVCSLTLSPLLPMPPSSIGCGHTTSRPTKPKQKRPVVSVTILLVVAKFVLLTAPTHPAWNRCVEQTSLRLIFPLSALEKKRIYGADVSNAFAEVPPPAQTFYMGVDHVFQHWWTTQLGRPRYRMDTSSLFNEPFKATPNPLVSGSVTSTPSWMILGLSRPPTSHASIEAIAMVTRFFFYLKSTTSPWPSMTPPSTRRSVTSSTPVLMSISNSWASSDCTTERISSRPAITYGFTLRVTSTRS